MPRLFFPSETHGWLPQLQEGSCSGRLEKQKITRAPDSGNPPQSQNKAGQGVGSWLGSHRHVARGPPSGMEGQSLFLPTQQERDGPEVGRVGRKLGDTKLGHQEAEAINKGFLWRTGSLWSQDGNKRGQLWEEWPGLCDILGPLQADTGRSLETQGEDGKQPRASHSLPPHRNTWAHHRSDTDPGCLPTFFDRSSPWEMPRPDTSRGVILSSALLCDCFSLKSLLTSLSPRTE